jgi:starvation-inducible DNA-binding protein
MQTAAPPPLSGPASEIQEYGTSGQPALGLRHGALVVEALNQILADALTLRDLYKKHHWQASGPVFYQLHLLFDKHHEQLADLVDSIAERVQVLGGVSVAMGVDAAEMTGIPRPPRGRETPQAQLRRLLAAHEILIGRVRDGARLATDHGDDGTNDLLVGGVLRTNEMQVWFLSEHLRSASDSSASQQTAPSLRS